MDTHARHVYEKELMWIFDVNMEVTGNICDSCTSPIPIGDTVYVYADRSEDFRHNWRISRTHCSKCKTGLELEPSTEYESVSAEIKCETYDFGNPDFLGLTRLETTIGSE